MRIGLTKYGLPQVVALPAIILAAMILCFLMGVVFLNTWLLIAAELVLAALLVFVLAFFRDPYRVAPQQGDILLAPADGRITDIEQVNEGEYIGGPALRIGIFLSIFDAHINRAPCEVKVAQINYKKGRFKDARDPLAGKVNESNDLKLVRTKDPTDKLIVRQISGAVARRIVCEAGTGDVLAGGEKFGMIKFGSRTELYMPVRDDIECVARVGDKVKAGLTAVARYKRCRN
jgi:phosphatidylserine decarboxylase